MRSLKTLLAVAALAIFPLQMAFAQYEEEEPIKGSVKVGYFTAEEDFKGFGVTASLYPAQTESTTIDLSVDFAAMEAKDDFLGDIELETVNISLASLFRLGASERSSAYLGPVLVFQKVKVDAAGLTGDNDDSGFGVVLGSTLGKKNLFELRWFDVNDSEQWNLSLGFVY